MQSGDTQRLLYIRPPRDLVALHHQLRSTSWKLLRMPYGISKAEQQWEKVIEGWLTNVMGFERVIGLNEMYIKYSKNGQIELILAKITDDMLFAGTVDDKTGLRNAMHAQFGLSNSIIDKAVIYNGFWIEQSEEGEITTSM